jgi:hypothetical protein
MQLLFIAHGDFLPGRAGMLKIAIPLISKIIKKTSGLYAIEDLQGKREYPRMEK